jgi:hypothetical protein
VYSFGGARVPQTIASDEVRVSRYRLRFLLQEFDLPRGITLLGRSLDCHVTIEDPLVSRQHARIIIDDAGATVEDLGSRNGVKVNGVTVRSPSELKDGDRLRIGTQDLVFCLVDPVGAAHAKTTGVLRLCANCRLPYPREMVACPNCEATEQTEEETLSGSFGADKQHSWTVQLLVEALEKALALARGSDADRIVRRATAQVEELIAAGAELDGTQLASLAVAASKTSVAAGDPTWGIWVADVYRRASRIPPSPVIDALTHLYEKFGGEMKGPILKLADHLRAVGRGATTGDAEGIARVEGLRRLVNGPPSEPHEGAGGSPASNPSLS